MLIENSNKNTGTWKTAEKKTRTLNRKINSTNSETIALKNRFSALATSNNEFIEATEDEEINYNVMIDKNPQTNQSKFKRRPNIIKILKRTSQNSKEGLILPSQKITLGLKTSKQFPVIECIRV